MTRTPLERNFNSWDNTQLFYRYWPPHPTGHYAIILFHRGHEHSARWQEMVDQLNIPTLHLFAWDARGHGLSPGERGYANSLNELVKDADSFIRHIEKDYQISMDRMIILGHSVGSVIASTWVHDYAPAIRGLILGSPALRVRLYVPFAIPALRLLLKYRSKSFISSYVKGRLLTHDPEKISQYDNDPLICPAIAVNVLVDLYDAGTRLMQDAGAITVPTLLLCSGADFVVKQQAQRRFYNHLPNLRKEMQVFPGFFHDTFNEVNRHLPIAKARMFIQDLLARPTPDVDLTKADKQGYTYEEYQKLLQPLPKTNPKYWWFKLQQKLLYSIGSLSDGIRIGIQDGFDSGHMLDYVYANKPSGKFLIGKWIDWIYLNAIGWRGIRLRRKLIEAVLHHAIEQQLTQLKEVAILDVAAGHGRYVLDVIQQYQDQPLHVLLQDYSKANVEQGQQRIAQLNLSAQAQFQRGDAFDAETIEQLSFRPSIIIVSGLYELFSDNDAVMKSLHALYSILAPQGLLIYTNQPWHPQLESIARILTSHQGGKPWIMRRRTQQEMDQLVHKAGFYKVNMSIEKYGIFSVSTAVKKPQCHPHLP
ncbi:bifunctional alpha/beta hydrolase/class I SAM-dependent methyltransferase [Zooshikella ganghwensis]|uniref:Alpha/beta fold hydrolase n=1 Tax=Zooshikella ganghwensis TaxID=202772 RepID=A0A4V1INJ1_9GAMM|nr:bifunctional alpha/beta hydrolase/class I SAM-dependent methyltransferase [Zooshikella ganghwensis]RDH43911.1 alpha/beta fold hydrolase [Zooshikella ganghwensis]